MKANWVTFYSYKGGVGRSMALANVAAKLAARGRCVVMIDFDLEAPGLDSFDDFDVKGAPGVVEYLDEFLRTKVTPPIENFVHECPVNSRIEGHVLLMPSGKKDSAYADKLHHTDWNALYQKGIAQPFIANWKAAIERKFRPDYVLVDSRTGLTDIGGICTLHVPDIVVALFALNRQNIEGTAGVLHAIRNVEGREPIQIVAVASPIPNVAVAHSDPSIPREEVNPLTKRLAEAQRSFSHPINAVINYFPSVALEERLWTLDESFPAPRIAEDYRTLTDQIVSRIHDGYDFLLSRANDVLKLSNEAAVDPLVSALSTQYAERAETQRTIARLHRMRGNRTETLEAYIKALVIDPSDEESFQFVSTQYKLLNRESELLDLIDSIALRISSDRGPRYFSNWFAIGQYFMMFSEYKKAIEAFDAALGCGPKDRLLLATRFNLAEARRRAMREINTLDWLTVLGDLEKISNDIALTAGIANRYQALHVAYAATGNFEKAEESLDRALMTAGNINQTAYIFSVATYTEVPVKEFIDVTLSMRRALSRGTLWDGMVVRPELAGA